MVDAWLRGARQAHTRQDGGTLKGGAPRAVWHTSETSPRVVSAESVAHCLEQGKRAAHLVWNPCSGAIVQMVPATRAAHMMDSDVDREGRTCIQIVVVGHASEPFTNGPMNGLESILRWLDSWSVPRRWPAGPPLPSPQAYHAVRNRRLWARGGHFGCSQVPRASGPDPGGIDIRKITGPETHMAEIPRPRDAPDPEHTLDLRPRLLIEPAPAPASSRF